ncbi:MAG: hypothetical protein EA382_07080 [Spirochaetaceae bacterium]|nr:MAG: hypothetical protein EA382_07080 [Spirochaetaceae bacterium]
MRTRRRRRAPVARTYTIGQLLAKQPQGLKRIPGFDAMMAHYHASQQLQRLRMNRRCYGLLANARIAPENLRAFYRTYRLPDNAFFPLFLAVKRRYLTDRERANEARHDYVLARMRALARPTLTWIKYLGHLERAYNAAGLSPVWQKHLFPTSKKRADAYTKHSEADWLSLYRDHLARLQSRYPTMKEIIVSRVYACIVLGLVPDRVPPLRPPATAVNRCYRRQSLLHHPDRGGDPAVFIAIKEARDTLIGP